MRRVLFRLIPTALTASITTLVHMPLMSQFLIQKLRCVLQSNSFEWFLMLLCRESVDSMVGYLGIPSARAKIKGS
jgi:hypothetical protein